MASGINWEEYQVEDTGGNAIKDKTLELFDREVTGKASVTGEDDICQMGECQIEGRY